MLGVMVAASRGQMYDEGCSCESGRRSNVANMMLQWVRLGMARAMGNFEELHKPLMYTIDFHK